MVVGFEVDIINHMIVAALPDPEQQQQHLLSVDTVGDDDDATRYTYDIEGLSPHYCQGGCCFDADTKP